MAPEARPALPLCQPGLTHPLLGSAPSARTLAPPFRSQGASLTHPLRFQSTLGHPARTQPRPALSRPVRRALRAGGYLTCPHKDSRTPRPRAWARASGVLAFTISAQPTPRGVGVVTSSAQDPGTAIPNSQPQSQTPRRWVRVSEVTWETGGPTDGHGPRRGCGRPHRAREGESSPLSVWMPFPLAPPARFLASLHAPMHDLRSTVGSAKLARGSGGRFYNIQQFTSFLNVYLFP